MPGWEPPIEPNTLWILTRWVVTSREINIKAARLQHFKDIGHDPAILDVTTRTHRRVERTQILMDIANKEGGPRYRNS